MSEPLIGVVVAHTEVAEALVGAVRAIAGDDAGLVAVSNRGCDRAGLLRRIDEAVAGRRALLFTDMAGGSCGHTAAVLARARPDLRVVTGVNLGMLVDFAFHRDLSAEAAAERAVQTGRAAVGVVGAHP
jgi:mannose/fructose-specific phosphotransferase system component IIA